MPVRVDRTFEPSSRYCFDLGECSLANGYAQLDTGKDAHYYGTWINPFLLRIVCYCEGDVTRTQTDSAAELIEEVRRIKQWNEDNGHRFIGIDPGFNQRIAEAFRQVGLGEFLS